MSTHDSLVAAMDRMINKLKRIWEEAVLVRSEVLCRHLPTATEEFYESR
jgi:hypothetical protein